MAVGLAEMTEADLPEVLALWDGMEGVGLNESDTFERLAAYLRRNPGFSQVAREGARIVGAVLCGHDGRRGYLHHLAVAPDCRRQGLGSELIARCLAALGAEGILKCNVFVYSDNDDGSAFWRRIGWGDRSDLKVMQRVIPPSA